jgi:DNA-binding GntR family transcriptional regulator
VYEVVASVLRDRIFNGGLGPDRRLPTEAELSASFSVSRQTVRKAFSELVAEGLVYRVPGRGTFAVVAPTGERYVRSVGSIEELLAQAVDSDMEIVRPFEVIVDVSAAGRLRLEDDKVAVATTRRLNKGEPFSASTTYLPPALAELIADDPRISTAGATSQITIIGLLEEQGHGPLAGAHQSISAAIAEGETAALIGSSLGEPVLTIDRVFFDRQGRFVELSVTTFNVRRYSYRLEMRRSSRSRISRRKEHT